MSTPTRAPNKPSTARPSALAQMASGRSDRGIAFGCCSMPGSLFLGRRKALATAWEILKAFARVGLSSEKVSRLLRAERARAVRGAGRQQIRADQSPAVEGPLHYLVALR